MKVADWNKTRYTHRDYESLKKDLISAIPSLTQEWTSRDESDPGIVLIKLMSMLGDNLSYNIDKIALEMYINSVTQRKNCASILKLLGYKMHWYRTARLTANVKVDKGTLILSPFVTTLRTEDSAVTYTVINRENPHQDYLVVPGSPATVDLVEGVTSSTSFTKNTMTNNRYYLPHQNIDESFIWLYVDDPRMEKSPRGVLTDNLYLVADDDRLYFEFNVDEYDRPYIELISYWKDIVGEGANFTVRFISTKGAEGSVSSDVLKVLRGHSGTGIGSITVSHLNNNTRVEKDLSLDSLKDKTLVNSFNSPGYDPQDVDEAREDSANYVWTYDTLVTVSDFEKAARRYPYVDNSKLVDNQVIKNEGLEDVVGRGDILPTDVNGLKPYCAVLYLAYRNFDQKYNSFDTDLSGEPNDKGYYPYKPLNSITSDLNDQLVTNYKMMNVAVEFGTVKLYPFKVNGSLHLTEPLGPEEVLTIVTRIDEDLKEEFNAGRKKFGDKPNFIDIVETIQNSDNRIKYFDASCAMIEYNPNCVDDGGLRGFDTTSFTVYNGLGRNFNLDSKFMKFTIRNTSAEKVTVKLGSRNIVVEPGAVSQEIVCQDLVELKDLCSALREDSNLSYVQY